MTYQETIDYLYSQTPQFQQIGAAAYKPGLGTVVALAEAFGNPQNDYKVIHVAGTNGKGSTSHTLAAVLQEAGYKVGLYTSPHLIDFRERMRVNGQMIPREKVMDFMSRYQHAPEELRELHPSFFELTTVMAFDWFAQEKVDVAVIEVGLGGRLDSTNIVNPELSVITNVSFDHMAQLGNTLRSIAHEKAGIMRKGVKVVCGEPRPEIRAYFSEEAEVYGTQIEFALETGANYHFDLELDALVVRNTPMGELRYQLTGDCQRQNSCTVVSAIESLRHKGWQIDDDAVKRGFANVCTLTGLMGRWMRVNEHPLVICDTGHNIGGWELLSEQLKRMPRPLTVALGFVNDKNLTPIMPLLPKDAEYIFTNASVPRALPSQQLAETAAEYGLTGECALTVADAYKMALAKATANGGSVFVGGSTFVVADLLEALS